MLQVCPGNVDMVARLLQEPRVCDCEHAKTTNEGSTALMLTCRFGSGVRQSTSIAYLLIQAGADPTITDSEGLTPLAFLGQRRPSYHTTIALLEQALADIEKTWLIVKPPARP
jgi:ankyrin repeat protein